MTHDQGPHVWLSDYTNTSTISQSELILEKSSKSNGLQLADIVLWIYSRKFNDKDISSLDGTLLNEILERSYEDGNTLTYHSRFLKSYK